MLLAGLAANVKYSLTDQQVEWNRAFGSVLMNIAWVVPRFHHRNLRTSARRFTMDRVILKLVQNILTPDQIDNLTLAIEAMKALESEDRRFRIFERRSKEGGEGNFQFNSVGTSADGTLSMKFNAYAFDTNTTVTNILWFSFSGNRTSLKVDQTTCVLNEAVYARVRDAIQNRLVPYIKDWAGGVELPLPEDF